MHEGAHIYIMYAHTLSLLMHYLWVYIIYVWAPSCICILVDIIHIQCIYITNCQSTFASPSGFRNIKPILQSRFLHRVASYLLSDIQCKSIWNKLRLRYKFVAIKPTFWWRQSNVLQKSFTKSLIALQIARIIIMIKL